MNDESVKSSNRYDLTFIDGQTWNFYFSPGLKEWGKEFSTIIGLQGNHQRGNYRVYFYKDDEIPPLYSPPYISQNQTLVKQCQRLSLKWMEMQYVPLSSVYCGFFHHPMDTDHEMITFHQRSSALFPLYRETIRTGGLVLHGALLHHATHGGIAILAPSGTGKSTCAERVPPHWSSWSDDLLLLVKTAESSYNAHPLPTWSNFLWNRDRQKQWNVHQQTHMKGFFFLQKSDKDLVVPLSNLDAAQWLYDSSLQVMGRFVNGMPVEDQRTLKRKIFENACKLSLHTPSVILMATKEGHFWREIETYMEGL